MSKRRAVLFVILFVFVGCNEYYVRYNGSFGYSDVSWNRIIEVTYAGSRIHTQTDARRFALVRLAHCAWLKKYPYFKIVEEQVDCMPVEAVLPAESKVKEVKDSTGTKTVTVSSTPSHTVTYSRPSVTIRGEVCSHCNNSDCIEVEAILHMAEEEGILIREKGNSTQVLK